MVMSGSMDFGAMDGMLQSVSIGIPKEGTVMAVGHYFSDSELDFIVRQPDRYSLTIYRQTDKQYAASKVSLKHHEFIYSVVAADFNHDGLLDLMVLSHRSPSYALPLTVSIYLQADKDHQLHASDWRIGPVNTQPLLIDYEGLGKIDIFARDTDSANSVWVGRTLFRSGKIESIEKKAFPAKLCTLRSPQYSAYADFDGDGLPDILVQCEDGSLEIWRNSDRKEYSLGRKISLDPDFPADGPLTVADVDGSGSLDLVYYSRSGNALVVMLNHQKRYCAAGEDGDCKKKKQLFQLDDQYNFDKSKQRILRFADIFPDRGWFGLKVPAMVLADPFDSPLSLHSGDFDMDGYPDILLVIEAAGKRRPVILQNDKKGSFKELAVKGLVRQHKAHSLAFLPFTPNTRLPDLVLLADGHMEFLRNEFHRDAFFLQVQVGSGVCERERGGCDTRLGVAASRPMGAGSPGATFKYAFVDPDGQSQVRQGSQLAQTGHSSLPLPFMLFGLGRVSNFIEEAQASCAAHSYAFISSKMSHLIPNARLLALPPPFGHWRVELYINPAEYIMWVGVAAASVCTVFALLTGFFKFKEVREDNMEKRRALHSFNFDAL